MSTRLCRRTNSSWATCATRRWCARVVEGIDEVYQLAADMGGAGYIFTGEHDADGDAQFRHDQSEHAGIRRTGRSQAVLLLLLGVHLPGAQPARSGESQVLRRLGLPGRARQRVRLGEAVQRAPVSSPTSAITASQVRVARFHNIFGPRRHVVRRPRKGARRDMPQSGGGARRRRDRDLGRRPADALVPVHRRVPRRRRAG